MVTKKQNKKMLDTIEGKEKSCDIVNIGFVGVDSGQILLCDPCYIGSEWENEEFEKPAKCNSNFSYNACCQKTLDLGYGQLNYKLGHAGVGVVSTTGWGDGCYPVYAKIDKKTGRVKELKVVFF
jgi:hypothetical protein